MKIMTQDKTRVLNFKMTYISYVSKNRICEGDFGIAEYASPERAKEVLRSCSSILASDFSAKAVYRGTAAADGRTTEAE